ncbi:hypothetical protein MMC13_002673 [Lambiella insularis]|nr:hypothetical protein [Lambiella insularis]
MTILKTQFTPEDLITAPRRSSATPSPDGKYALYTANKYALESHSETIEVQILDLDTERSTLFSDNQRNKAPSWLGNSQILWSKDTDDGSTEIWTASVGREDKNSYLVGSIAASITNIRTKQLRSGQIAFAFTADANPDGSLHNPAKAPKPFSSARDANKKYKLSDKNPVNALKGTPLTCPVWPNDYFHQSGFDISTTGFLVTARDPEFNPAESSRTNLWYIPLRTFKENPAPTLEKIRVLDHNGSTSSAVFSSSGTAAAFLKTKFDSREGDSNRAFIVEDLSNLNDVKEIKLLKDKSNHDLWDLSPSSLTWASDGHRLYVTAHERARGKLFKLERVFASSPSAFPSLAAVPISLSDDGTVVSVFPQTQSPSDHRLFVNKTSFTANSVFCLIDPRSRTQSFLSRSPRPSYSLRLLQHQISEISFKGYGDYDVHAWVIKPSDFHPSRTYPLAMLFHGGPAGNWADAWSQGCNPAVFTGQAMSLYYRTLVAQLLLARTSRTPVQVTGGGRPYHDLASCFAYIESQMPFVDTNRAVALGGSYGGYMINWIAGQPLAKRFKALVCHDVIFSFYNMLSTDLAASFATDMGGPLWKNKSTWDKNYPAQLTQSWTQPMLFIHSDGDYRCPLTQGLAAFSVCQMKGIDSRFLNFPDETHVVSKPENLLRWYKSVLGWINKYAGVEGGVVLESPISEPHRR